MSTRATIAYKLDDGRYTATYLQYDGYPEHAGKILQKHFKTLESIETLVAAGALRSLNRDGTAERPAKVKPAVVIPTRAALHEFANTCGAEFLYIFEGEAWHTHNI